MIEFRDPVIEDRAWVEELFHAAGNRGCEYSFATMFLWHSAYRQKVARFGDFVLEYLTGSIGPSYLFPAGQGDLRPVIEALEADAAERGEPCKLICVTAGHMEQLESLFPGQYEYTTDRFGFDYLYEIDRLASLGGKKLHAKRNHIHRFEEAHPDWTVEEITPANLPECVSMNRDWNRLYRNRDTEDGTPEDETLRDESHALARAFQHYEDLGLSGLLLRTEGKVAAFTMGSPITPDTFDIHFEKAYSEMQGAYPLINREFARWIQARWPEVRYLNREDDMGVEGLRKAKESYYPDLMVEKHSAVRKE
ncbi:MAG: DUF2156 domain-containing protein [Oscillospiraceae bacterium]|nr:DUF2156 domain-containing protein [Oscillospiraceae bacterium]